MPADLTQRNIRTIDQYLELIARAIFASGLSWVVVDRRSPQLRSAFAGFSARAVAALTESEVKRLADLPGVISNERKIAAVVEAARLLVGKKDEFGSIGRWLGSMSSFHEQQRALRSLSFVGPFGAYYVLSVAGFEVPDYEAWRAEYAPAMATQSG